MKPQDCALIILASGLSERFGPDNKLLADLGGKPVIRHVIDNAATVNFGGRYAVVSSEDVANLCETCGYIVIRNDNPQAGQGYALSLGAKAAKAAGHIVVCIMLADMPFVGVVNIETLLQAAKNHTSVFSEYEGVHMPPAIFSGAAFDGLTRVSGDEGAKPSLGRADAASCPHSKRSAIDIDTFAALASARRDV